MSVLYLMKNAKPIKHLAFDEDALKDEIGVTELFGEKGLYVS